MPAAVPTVNNDPQMSALLFSLRNPGIEAVQFRRDVAATIYKNVSGDIVVNLVPTYNDDLPVAFPEQGQRMESAALVTHTGVSDAVFAERNGRCPLYCATSREGAIALAEKALEGYTPRTS